LFLKQFKILVENIFTCQNFFARRVLKALCESYFALNNNFWIKRQLWKQFSSWNETHFFRRNLFEENRFS
jgi:hypothetical protein